MDGLRNFTVYYSFSPLFFLSFALLLATQQTAVLIPSTFDQVLYRIGSQLLSAMINEETSVGSAFGWWCSSRLSFRFPRIPGREHNKLHVHVFARDSIED